MSIHSYELAADGSDFDERWVNEIAESQGRILNVSINPMKNSDYIIWRVGDVYYAQNGRTGVVTSDAACHALVNGLLATNKSYYFVGDITYILTAPIELGGYEAIRIYGNPARGTVFQPSADGINAFDFNENWWCVLEGFKIDGVNQTTNGRGIIFSETTGTNYAKHNIIRDVDFADCWIGVTDLDAETNGGSNNLFIDCNFYDSKYLDVALTPNGTGFWRFVRCTFDHIATQASNNFTFTITGADGLVMDTCSFLMGGAASHGSVRIRDTDFIWMDNCDIEKAGETGWYFENCTLANISNLRMSEAAMNVGATGDACLKLLACRDFNITNFTLGTTSNGATNLPVIVGAFGGTESDHTTFMNGLVTGSAGVGINVKDASSNIKFLGLDAYGNADDDIKEEDTANYNTYKNNNMNSGVGWTLIGPNNVYDQFPFSVELDLTGGATDVPTFFAPTDCVLAGYRIFYTVATGIGAAVDIRVGRAQDGVALDDDYFDISASEQNEAIGHEGFFNTAALTQQVIAAGDIVYVGTAGGKADTGAVRLVLSIMENAS